MKFARSGAVGGRLKRLLAGAAPKCVFCGAFVHEGRAADGWRGWWECPKCGGKMVEGKAVVTMLKGIEKGERRYRTEALGSSVPSGLMRECWVPPGLLYVVDREECG